MEAAFSRLMQINTIRMTIIAFAAMGFGLFTVPELPVGSNKDLGGKIYDVHETGAKFMLLLIVLHVAGALKHTINGDYNLTSRDEVLNIMNSDSTGRVQR